MTRYTKNKYSRHKKGHRMIVQVEQKRPGLPTSAIRSRIKQDRDKRRSIVKDRSLTALGVTGLYLLLCGMFHVLGAAQYTPVGVVGVAIGTVIFHIGMGLYDCKCYTGKAFDIDDWR